MQRVGVLVDRVRRALYNYVRRAGRPVTRDEAARAQHISRNLAAHHLDKLVDVGLLASRLDAGDGPRGRGRTPKVYEVSCGVEVSIPGRQYELIGQILADAVAEDPTRARSAAERIANERGRAIAAGSRAAKVTTLLENLGFEPRTADRRTGCIRLRNCPFHALAQNQTALVCGLNQAFVAGLLDGLGDTEREARLAPRPDSCCVEIAERSDRAAQGRSDRRTP